MSARGSILAMLGLLAALIVVVWTTESDRRIQNQSTSTRPLEMFTAALSRDLTANRAIELFGEPDKITESGLVIYIYHLNDGRSILLSFPGAAPISSAHLEDQDGNAIDLPLPETAPGKTNADPSSAGRVALTAGADGAANEVSLVQAGGPTQIDSFELTRTIVADWGSDNAGRPITGAVERIWHHTPND
ncbi:MAG: hypothetical protein MI924_15520 [Chloroflexales bacterium]|nr:hypothetical protein [Chloroflexales bacterium]